jgi:hypothetical protein
MLNYCIKTKQNKTKQNKTKQNKTMCLHYFIWKLPVTACCALVCYSNMVHLDSQNTHIHACAVGGGGGGLWWRAHWKLLNSSCQINCWFCMLSFMCVLDIVHVLGFCILRYNTGYVLGMSYERCAINRTN